MLYSALSDPHFDDEPDEFDPYDEDDDNFGDPMDDPESAPVWYVAPGKAVGVLRLMVLLLIFYHLTHAVFRSRNTLSAAKTCK